MSFFGVFGNESGSRESQDGLDETCQLFSLTKTQRMYGFGICFALGFLFSFLGTITLVLGRMVSFAVLYTIGNVVSLMGTGFLVGPCRQIKSMFDPVRVVATIVFFVSMGLTLMFAFIKGLGGLCIIFVVIQFCAFTWYCASYIPYGRTMIKKCVGGLCDV